RAALDPGAEGQPPRGTRGPAILGRDRDLTQARGAALAGREHHGVAARGPRRGDGWTRAETGCGDPLDGIRLQEAAAVAVHQVPVEDLLFPVLLAEEEDARAVGRPDRIARSRDWGGPQDPWCPSGRGHDRDGGGVVPDGGGEEAGPIRDPAAIRREPRRARPAGVRDQ